MQAISVLIKPASGMCNMHCDYCFYCDEAQKRKQKSYGFMSERTLKNIIRKTLTQARQMAAYAFQGGEPTLRGLDFFEKLMEYEKQYNTNHVQIHNAIQTNGFAIDENWCRFFKKNNFLVGVSLDGLQETHNAYRCDKNGNPTFEKIYHNIQMMEKFGVDFNILTVVNRRVADNIKKIYQFYKKSGWNYQQYIVCLDPLEEVRGEAEYALTPDKYGIFLTELFDLWYEDWKEGKQPYIRQFENYVAILVGYYPEACNQRGICTVQNVAEADGSVYPCDFYMLDEYKLGNFNEDRLEEIMQKGRSIAFAERSLNLDEECKKCKYYSICKGGCQRERDLNEQTGSYKNYFCGSYQYFFDKCLERLEKIAQSLRRKFR